MGRSISLKVGDKVIAAHNFNPSIKESGVIVGPWIGDRYDWWVDLTFISEGVEYTSTIPYYESELTLLEE